MKVKIENKNKKSKFQKDLNKVGDDHLLNYIKKYIKDNSVEEYLTELTKIILRRN